MKIINIFLSVLVIGLFIVSCSDEDFDQNDNKTVSNKTNTANISTRPIAENLINAIKDNPTIATEINNAIRTVARFAQNKKTYTFDDCSVGTDLEILDRP